MVDNERISRGPERPRGHDICPTKGVIQNI